MLVLLSPAKSLDFETEVFVETTNPRFLRKTEKIIQQLKLSSVPDLMKMMSISDNLATVNTERYSAFNTDENPEKAAIYAFTGDVYQGFDAPTMSVDGINFAQAHVRILSGLYGLLRPLDKIQPYRLEMGTSISIDHSKNLYEYWEDSITKLLNEELLENDPHIILNLASNEYFKSVNKKNLVGQVVDVEFKDFKDGQYKIISFFAKKARGLMARFICENEINTISHIKGFDIEGYRYEESLSEKNKLVFLRG